MTYSVNAQVYITEIDYENPRNGTETEWGYLPEQWGTNDQANAYAPLGDGLVILAALGGAYLVGRWKKVNNNK